MPQDPSTPSPEYLQMEAARYIPRLLDSSRPDGGVMRLLTSPGGKPGEFTPGLKTVVPDAEAPGGQRVEQVAAGQFQAAREVPLLIQHMAETDADFYHRAITAAPRGNFWHSVKALAGRPFSKPIEISPGAPEELQLDGSIARNLDGLRNGVEQMSAHLIESSAGYGINYALVEINREGRPVVREIPAQSIVNVRPGPGGSPQLMVSMVSKTRYEGGGIDSATAKAEQEELCMVFHRGDPTATNDARYAWYQVFERERQNGDRFSQNPSRFPHPLTGREVDRVSLAPHSTIPLEPIPSGRLSACHFILPPMLTAAKLDHLLLQINSNTEYCTNLANAPLRFAKGVDERTGEDWRVAGSRLFYFTPSENADMKWVVLPADALEAGMKLADVLVRAIEVEGLAPMMTRSTGDERALGMALATSRARSAAEMMAICWSSALTRIWRRLALYQSTSIDLNSISVTLNYDFGATEENMQAAQMLARLYLDPTSRVTPSVFWAEMRRLGMVGDSVDLDTLSKWTEEPGRDLKEAELQIRKAELLRGYAQEGLFTGENNRVALYRSLQDLGVLPEGFDPVVAAREDARNGLLMTRNLSTLESLMKGEL